MYDFIRTIRTGWATLSQFIFHLFIKLLLKIQGEKGFHMATQ